MEIRPEQHGDEQAIHDLTETAFATMPYSAGTEAPIIRDLRENGDLTVSLVAIQDGKLTGHIAFSPVTIEGETGGWFGLGPVSVHPECQRSGIGTALVEKGLSILQLRGAKGCALIGEPDYYSRFGFISDGRLIHGDVPARYVQWLAFGAPPVSGYLRFSPAFEQ